jgi:DMSO/TMAO reductase YedYZ molybdopterin-dependent catalytic subunit
VRQLAAAFQVEKLVFSLWEGVPLREVIWLTRPKENVRRVYYQSYHQEGLAPFQSSLPMGHVLESARGDMPVIVAYESLVVSHQQQQSVKQRWTAWIRSTTW